MEQKAIALAKQWFYKHAHELPIKVFCWESMGERSQVYWIQEADQNIT